MSLRSLDDFRLICANEIGLERTAELLAQAGVHATTHALRWGRRDPASTPEDEASETITQTGWTLLAASEPQLFEFVPRCAQCDGEIHYSNLPFLYARKSCPQTLRLWKPEAEDKRLLSRARCLARDYYGLPGLKRACRYWVFDDDCLPLRGRPAGEIQDRDVMAWCQFDRHSRRDIIIDGRQIAKTAWLVPYVLIHEEVHAAVLQASDPRRCAALTDQISKRLLELPSALAEMLLWVDTDSDSDHDFESLAKAQHITWDGPLALQMLRELDAPSLAAALRALAQTTVKALASGSEAGAVKELNHVYGHDWTRARWDKKRAASWAPADA